MFAEIIIYIALFTALFSSAFMAAFQTIDAVQYLQVQKNMVDDLYFLQSRLDSLVKVTPDWETLSGGVVVPLISNPRLLIGSLSSKIFETATSSSRVLFLTLSINKKIYTFSYVQEK